MERAAVWYAVASTAVGVTYYLLPTTAGQGWAWQVMMWLGLAALAAGVRRNRPPHPGVWHAVTAATGLMTTGHLLGLVLPASVPETWRWAPFNLLTLIAFLTIGGATAVFARTQSGARDRGPVVDSAIVTLALTTLLWEAAFSASSTAWDGGGAAALLVADLATSWVLAMALRPLLAGGYRLLSGWLVFLSAACTFMAIALILVFGAGQSTTGRSPLDVLWIASMTLLGAAALHPSMRGLTQPADPHESERALVWARTGLPGLALLLPPIAVLLRALVTGDVPYVAAGSSVVVAVVVVGRFAQLVAARERSRREALRLVEHQRALARLGELALAGGHAADLRRAADALLADAAGDEAYARAVGHVLEAAEARRRAEEALRHQSLHDALTGLANRVLLVQRLEAALADGRGVAVVFADLDGFKQVNDTLGHGAGDRLLIEIAARLRAVVGERGTLSRFAGDEFVGALEGMGLAEAEALAAAIVAAVRAPVPIADAWARVTASVGVAVGGEDADADTLLREADLAMYRAKEAGRDRVTLAPAGVAPYSRG